MSKNSDLMTYEDLGTVYRMEKSSRSLSAVRRDLYPAMARLIVLLRSEYEKHLSADPDSIMCEGANQHRKKAASMAKEITELRMEKISSLALLGARGSQNKLDNLTPEEREYYDHILDISRRHLGIVDKLTGKRKFDTPPIVPDPVVEEKKPEPAAAEPEPAEEITEVLPDPLMEEMIEELAAEEPEDEWAIEQLHEKPKEKEPEEEMVVIRILEDLPPFSGPDRNYDLSKEDIVRMPKAMAVALINREKAVLFSPGP